MKASGTIGVALVFCVLSTILFGNSNIEAIEEIGTVAPRNGLYVKGSKKFKLRVVRDLQRLTNYRLDIQFFSGKIIIYGIDYSERRRKPFGNELLKQLIYSNELIEIRYSTDGKNRFVASSQTKMILKSPVGGTILYHPKRKFGGLNIFEERSRPPYIGLAHELIHSAHAVTGTAEMGMLTGICLDYDEEVTMEEHQARVEENKIREELGISARKIPQGKLECCRDESVIGKLQQLMDYLCRVY